MYNIVELFSGIGSQAKAIHNIDIQTGCVYTCEWNIHALTAYDAIHNDPTLPFEILKKDKDSLLSEIGKMSLSIDGKNPADYDTLKKYSASTLRRIYSAISRCNNYIDICSLKGKDLPNDIDILTYSFPCQDVSNVGAFHGYNKGIEKNSGSRSSLLWQVGRILKEMHRLKKALPRFLVMENVPALLSARHKKNFELWISELNKLGYISKYYQLNAFDFGIPQNRPRLIMISVFCGDNEQTKAVVSSYFNAKDENEIINDYKDSPYYCQLRIEDLLRIDYSNPKLYAEACECTPNDTPSRRKIWQENPQLVLKGNIVNPEYKMIRTITTKQDRNPNSGNLYIDTGIEGRSHFRYLTPRECFLFMGFTDEDYNKVIKYNPEVQKGTALFPRDQLIRMAGNSIPVKLLEGVFLQIKQLDSILNH